MLSQQIQEYAETLPEGNSLSAKGLLHLGSRAAVDQALSRLTKKGSLIRAGQGIYMTPTKSRFGARGPSVEETVEAFSCQRGEVIVPNGAAAANALGLTTQVPVRSIYLTSGRSRIVKLGNQSIELKHAPRWIMTLATRPVGQVIRALAWAGPDNAEKTLRILKRELPQETFRELVSVVAQLPTWLAQTIVCVAHEADVSCHYAKMSSLSIT